MLNFDIRESTNRTKISNALFDKTHGINNQINQSFEYIEQLCYMAKKTKLFANIRGFNSRDNINQCKKVLELLVGEVREEFNNIENIIRELDELDNKLHSNKNGYVTEISDHPLEYIGKVLNIDLDTDDRLI